MYNIYNTVDSDIYIGSTCCSLGMGMAKHRGARNNEKVKHRRLYNKMNEIGVDNFHIVLVEEMRECQKKNNYIRKKGKR